MSRISWTPDSGAELVFKKSISKHLGLNYGNTSPWAPSCMRHDVNRMVVRNSRNWGSASKRHSCSLLTELSPRCTGDQRSGGTAVGHHVDKLPNMPKRGVNTGVQEAAVGRGWMAGAPVGRTKGLVCKKKEKGE